jgi:2-polyprenyl-3-methyl-5-hydroxy-6-metoxy-1,4-benzoquinol methylase
MSDMEYRNQDIKQTWAARRKAVQPKAISLPAPGATDADGKRGATTQDVKRMYEQFPYPSPIVGDSLIKDLSNAVGFLLPEAEVAGRKVLDAGCGTGHRILALAQEYPRAAVTGIDMTEASLRVARQMMHKHDIGNLTFKQANLLELDLAERYDLITSTGVIHHLTDPQQGLNNLAAHLSPDGVMLIWLYHPYGEFVRLLNRELAMMLWGDNRSDFQTGTSIMRELELDLSTQQYGTETSNPLDDDLSKPSINVDAYLHPIVKAYCFHEAIAMLKRAGVDWIAVNGINLDGQSKLIDLEGAGDDPFFTINDDDLFATAHLRDRYRGLSKIDKLRAIELKLRPTGFNIVAGRNRSFERCHARIGRNLVEL